MSTTQRMVMISTDNLSLDLDRLRSDAKKGDIDAVFWLGIAYRDGVGVAPDSVEAERHLRRAADKDHIESIYHLGRLNVEMDVPDFAASMSLFKRAADAGHPLALHCLGCLHAEGKGVPRDAIEARRHWLLAAEQGIAGALLNLGTMYFKGGDGVPRNSQTAIAFWRVRARYAVASSTTSPDFESAVSRIARSSTARATAADIAATETGRAAR